LRVTTKKALVASLKPKSATNLPDSWTVAIVGRKQKYVPNIRVNEASMTLTVLSKSAYQIVYLTCKKFLLF
jgi:hypothetical protein